MSTELWSKAIVIQLKSQKNNRYYKPRLEMAALIDVVFILLIFFAVSTTLVLNKKGVRLALPEAVSVTENKLGYVVSIDKYNTIFFQDKPILPELLISTVKSLIIEQPEMHIVLNADKETDYVRVVEVLDLIRLGGCFDVVLEAKKKV